VTATATTTIVVTMEQKLRTPTTTVAVVRHLDLTRGDLVQASERIYHAPVSMILV
jgi:hypothetical protein